MSNAITMIGGEGAMSAGPDAELAVTLYRWSDALEWTQSRLSPPRVSPAVPQGDLVALLYLFEERDARATDHVSSDLTRRRREGPTLIKKLDDLRLQNIGWPHETQANARILQAWKPYRQGEGLAAKTLNWTETKDLPSHV